MTADELFDKYSVAYNIKQLIEPMELMNKHQFMKAVAEIISFPLELPVSAENGDEEESFEIFDKLLGNCTKAKLFSGEYYWLTSEKRIYKIAKKYLSRVEMRKLEEKYASRFSH